MLRRIEMWIRLRPAVPRHWLFAVGGLIWTVVGLLLCTRAVVWLATFALSTEFLIEIVGVVLASAGYVYGLSKVVQKNITRINGLPDRACAFAFTGWRGYIMIGLMVTLGITVRNSFIPKYYLSIPYTAMGGMLLIGSLSFYRQFLEIALRRK
ncbi:MAG: hypothetical protein WBW16_13220 [Bacteroidota bacterium]